MGKPIVATDADGLLDVLTHEHDALIVPKRDAAALAAGIVRLIDSPEDRARLSVHARVTGQQYDIAAFVRKMERLYDLLHEVSRRTKRQGVLQADLSFLTEGRARDAQAGPDPRGRLPLHLRHAGAGGRLAAARYGFQSDEATYYMMGLSLVHDGDLDVSQGGSRPRLAGVSGRSGRRVPEARADDRRRTGSRSEPATSTASRSSIRCLRRRSSCSSAPTAFSSCNAMLLALVLLCGYLFLHARSGAWPSAILAAGVRHGERRAGLFRPDHAGGVQLLAGVPGVLLLAL